MDKYTRIVAVTGASRGLGLELVHQFSDSPTTLVLALVRDLHAEAPVLAHFVQDRENIKVVACDLGNEKSIVNAAEEIRLITGGRLDILINNGAIHPGEQNLTEETFATLEHAIKVNVLGPILATKCLIPLLKEGKDKIIVNFSSILGSNEWLMSKENIFPPMFAYNFTKGANVIANTLISMELKEDGFKCIAWSPGWSSTDMGKHVKIEGHAEAVPPLSPHQSVVALIKKMNSLKREDNGKFFGVNDSDGPIVELPF